MATSSASSSSPAFADGTTSGFDFFKNWMQAASSGLPHLAQTAASTAPGAASAWTLPTLDPQELEKRLNDLRTVKFWLEQNTQMLSMTIQTLEVQRMTLETLKGMNVPLGALQDALKSEPDGSSPHILSWWETLSKQFLHLTQQVHESTQEQAKASKPKATKPSEPEVSAVKPSAPLKASKKTSRRSQP